LLASTFGFSDCDSGGASCPKAIKGKAKIMKIIESILFILDSPKGYKVDSNQPYIL
jgi:hypothetical protein